MASQNYYFSFEKISEHKRYNEHFLCLHTIGAIYNQENTTDKNWYPINDCLVTVVKDGHYTFSNYNDDNFTPIHAYTGDVCFFFPNEIPQYSSDENSSRLWLHIIGSAVPDILNDLGVTPKNRFLHLNQNTFIEVLKKFNKLIDIAKTGDNMSLYANAKLLDFLSAINNSFSNKNIDTDNATTIERVKNTVDFMNNCYREEINIKSLADMCYIGEHHFLKLFKSIYNKTPHQFLMSIRMNAAINYLVNTSTDITEIAILTGFTDRTYFSKSFKNYFGVTPSEYRKNPIHK